MIGVDHHLPEEMRIRTYHQKPGAMREGDPHRHLQGLYLDQSLPQDLLLEDVVGMIPLPAEENGLIAGHVHQ